MSENLSPNSLPETNKLIKISSFENCVFNSKLFLDLDSVYNQSLNTTFDKDPENLSDMEEIDNESFLIGELIEELDSKKTDSLKDENPINLSKSIITLVDKGYEFLPKGYRKSVINTNKLPKNFNKYNISGPADNNFTVNNYYQTKHKSIKERKGDWFCQLCSNLNFAFRKECNRCKVPKEKCIKNKKRKIRKNKEED